MLHPCYAQQWFQMLQGKALSLDVELVSIPSQQHPAWQEKMPAAAKQNYWTWTYFCVLILNNASCKKFEHLVVGLVFYFIPWCCICPGH